MLVTLRLKSIRMSLVLKAFGSRKASWHHVTKWSMTGPCEFSSLFCKLTITVSSENFTKCLFSVTERQSLVYRMWKRGKEHTPAVSQLMWGSSQRDGHLLSLTGIYLWGSLISSPQSSLNWCKSFSTSRWGWMVLKADEKSTNSSLACFLLPSRWLRMRLSTVTVASWTPLLSLYANCSGSRRFVTDSSS